MITLFAAAAASQIILSSPDGRLKIEVASDGSTYAVSRDGEPLIETSALGLRLADAPDLSGLRLVKVRKRHVDRTIPLTATKAGAAKDVFNEDVVILKESAGLQRQVSLEIRAYNDGVAWRYRFPDGKPVYLQNEATTFHPAGDPTCLVTDHTVSHESYFSSVKISTLDPAKLYDYPVVCASPSGKTHYAIAQAGLAGYAGSALKPGTDGLGVALAQRPNSTGPAVVSGNGLVTGWRVVMTADRAGDLIDSTLIGNLAQQASGDFSWVKPGKVAWDWWSGPTVGEKPSMERYRRFIDFAAASGFPYFLIDAGWAFNAGPCCAADERTDITHSDPAIDMPVLAQYAASKGVGLILWAHWKHVEPRMDEVLDTYARWGIKGVKVDFMERDDQDMVQFYDRLASETAKRHLLLDMHGAFPPEGLSRTYPNYITQEGVLGAEYNKFPWGQVTAGHNVKLAYTRMLLGPMDYTPGGFRNSYPDTYVQTEIMPSTRFTRGQTLAQYVVYESPLQMVSDDPVAYENATGFDFIKAVPTAWDETRFIDGTPDSYIVVARRKGAQWYIGAMNTEQARTIEVPLNALGQGQYNVELWQDGADANSVDKKTLTASDKDRLTINLAPGGGAAIVLTQLDTSK